jgi:hypothetical protein
MRRCFVVLVVFLSACGGTKEVVVEQTLVVTAVPSLTRAEAIGIVQQGAGRFLQDPGSAASISLAAADLCNKIIQEARVTWRGEVNESRRWTVTADCSREGQTITFQWFLFESDLKIVASGGQAGVITR